MWIKKQNPENVNNHLTENCGKSGCLKNVWGSKDLNWVFQLETL